jgi:predicted nucleic acid-binding protein
LIPEGVYQETIENGIKLGYSDAILLSEYCKNQKIRIQKISTEETALKLYLHLGEYETIMLAQELSYILVIDDKKARFVAEQKSLSFFSTLDIILLLQKEKTIDFELFQNNLGKYAKNGWINPQIIKQYLTEGKKYE